MHVVTTAGHVDHGKSTLVRALTGMEPDRLAEEQRRGMTIDLGFAWTGTEDTGTVLAFVDVPGHERFVPTMLAGAGPATAVLFVVAADDGWQAQSTEHLAALDAFGVRHGLLAVTKSDRADPAAATADALHRLRATSLGTVGSVAVSATTGAGLDELRRELLAMTRRLPVPEPGADVRLWVDRVFTVRGAGTVVTGTLGAGTLRTGDTVVVGGRRAVVRGLQTLNRPTAEVHGVARVAVNLRGVAREDVRRGDALLSPDAWHTTDLVDVQVRGTGTLHRELVLHVGTAAVPCRIRPLGTVTARLALRTALPLRAGDIGLLRDPGEHRIACGVEVLDPVPPTLAGRGAARARDRELTAGEAATAHLRRHGAVPSAASRTLGWTPEGVRVGDWIVDRDLHRRLPVEAGERFAAWSAAHPVAEGMPVATLLGTLRADLPADVLRAALTGTDLTVRNGLVRRAGAAPALPAEVDLAVTELENRLAAAPFAAPDATDLAALGLGPRELAAAERAGRLVRLAGSVVLAADALTRATRILATLPAPFTVSAARQALGTTRRVAVPLLEHLDAHGVTRRGADGARHLRVPG